VALTIAGSDSGGGAGIQADLKTFAAFGVHGTSAITAVTAQNTVTVSEIHEVPIRVIRAQIDAVVEDIGVQAAKTGMLASAEIIAAVAAAIREHGIGNLVVDPVMVAKGGARLLHSDAIASLYRYLLPLAAVITPNIPEAEVLLGRALETLADRRQAARDLVTLGPGVAVVKGGHTDEPEAIDIYWDGSRMVELAGRRIPTKNTHGSGCVFSAAITAGLARGQEPLEAVRAAKAFIERAIEHSLELGQGHGPVNPVFGIDL
jgi:hydroxymethylpyrimidine/phosphomethylpyrimidine kinase